MMARGGGLRALLPALCIVGAGAVMFPHRVLFAQTGANTENTCPNDETCMNLYGTKMEQIFARDSYDTSMWDTWTTVYLGKLDVSHTCNTTNLIRNAVYAELFDRGVAIDNYTNVVIGLEKEFFDEGGCEFTGLSDVGCSIGEHVKANCTSMVWMWEYTLEKLEILLHELGHTLGLNHAGIGDILDGPAYNDKDGPHQDPWKEYGDKTTLMGSQQAGDGMGFNGAERCLLNWIPAETVKTIDVAADNSGEYEVRLVNFALTPDAGVVEQNIYSAAKVRFPSVLSASPSTPKSEGRHSTAAMATVGATYYIRRVGMM